MLAVQLKWGSCAYTTASASRKRNGSLLHALNNGNEDDDNDDEISMKNNI